MDGLDDGSACHNRGQETTINSLNLFYIVLFGRRYCAVFRCRNLFVDDVYTHVDHFSTGRCFNPRSRYGFLPVNVESVMSLRV
jgi:hypothetical protein